METVPHAGIDAIQAWVRLEAALGEFDQHLRSRFGVTGGQLALLRIIGEHPDGTTLMQLRARLVMHPATLGQIVNRMMKLGLVAVEPAPEDRRSRRVRLSDEGSVLLRDAPLAGPVRLRSNDVDLERARRLAESLIDAVSLFGLEEWAT